MSINIYNWIFEYLLSQIVNVPARINLNPKVG